MPRTSPARTTFKTTWDNRHHLSPREMGGGGLSLRERFLREDSFSLNGSVLLQDLYAAPEKRRYGYHTRKKCRTIAQKKSVLVVDVFKRGVLPRTGQHARRRRQKKMHACYKYQNIYTQYIVCHKINKYIHIYVYTVCTYIQGISYSIRYQNTKHNGKSTTNSPQKKPNIHKRHTKHTHRQEHTRARHLLTYPPPPTVQYTCRGRMRTKVSGHHRRHRQRRHLIVR